MHANRDLKVSAVKIVSTSVGIQFSQAKMRHVGDLTKRKQMFKMSFCSFFTLRVGCMNADGMFFSPCLALHFGVEYVEGVLATDDARYSSRM